MAFFTPSIPPSFSSPQTNGPKPSLPPPPHSPQAHAAATTLADYMQGLFGSDEDGLSRADFESILQNGKFYSTKLGREVEVPKEVKDAINTLVVDERISLARLDPDRNDLLNARELRAYVSEGNGSKDIR